MKIFENPNVDTGFKILFGLLSLLGLMRLFSQADGKKGFSLYDFKKAVAFLFFLVGCVWILHEESLRTTEYHKFDGIWMAMMITGLFSSLHMEDVLDKMGKLLELMIQLRTKVGTTKTTEVSTTTTASVSETKKPVPPLNPPNPDEEVS